MRLVQVVVPDERRDDIVSALDDRNLGYSTTNETGSEEAATLVSFIAPADAVEYILNDLQEVGLKEEWYIASVETQFASFEGVDDVQDTWANTPNKVAPRTLRSKAKDMRLNTRSYLWMMTLATVVATSGLLVGSPAVVVGSMVLAPIVSPMLTASVGTVRNDRQMVMDSLRMQGYGLGVAVVGALLFSLLVKYAFTVPTTLDVNQMELISIRFSPGLLSVAVGLAAGAGGSFSLATKGQVSIVGVMIAAALIPTAAAAGIGFAWGQPVVGVGAITLLLVTITAVNLGATLMFKYLGYEPDDVDKPFFAFDSTRDVAAVAATLLAVLIVVTTVGVGSYQQLAFEQSVNEATTDVLEDGQYGELQVVGTTSEHVGIGVPSSPSTVTVTLSRTSDRQYSGLANDLDRAISNRTDESVTVSVQYQDYHRSNVSASLTEPNDRPIPDPAGDTA